MKKRNISSLFSLAQCNFFGQFQVFKNFFFLPLFQALALWVNAFDRSICPYLCLSVCLCVCEVPFEHLFAPTSRSQMSKKSTDKESLGKSNGKKWSQIWTFTNKWCKIAAQKKVCFLTNFVLLSRIFWYWYFSLRLTVLWPPLPEVQCPNFLDFLNSWGEKMKRSGLRFENFSSERVYNRRGKKSFIRIFFYLFTLFKYLFAPLPKVHCPNFLDFQNPWGKVMVRSVCTSL